MMIELIWILVTIGLAFGFYALFKASDFRVILLFISLFIAIGVGFHFLDFWYLIVALILFIIPLGSYLYSLLGE